MSFARLAGIPLASLVAALGIPAVAQAQGVPLAGLISKIIQESTFNAPTPGANGAIVAHQGHFLVGEALKESARQMNVDLGEQLLSFPLGSSSGGFSFTTNSMTGEVSPSSETFGPAFAERAITIGRGQANVGFAFRSTSFDSFEGVKLDSGGLSFIRQHNDCCPPAGPNSPSHETDLNPAFERDLLQSNLKLDMTSRASVFYATFGVSDRLDVGLAVPFVHVDIDATVDGHILRLGSGGNSQTHVFQNGTDRQTFAESGSSDGLGDISLRAKYNFLRGDTTAMAGFVDLRLPTGNKDELLGTGATRAEMLFIYSGDYGRVSPHVNVGYTLSRGDSSEIANERDIDYETPTVDVTFNAIDLALPDEFNYTFGVNVAAASRVTVGFDVKGRVLRDVARFDLEDNLYQNRGTGALPQPTFTATQEFSLKSERSSLNLLLGVVGAKINVAKTLLLNANVLFPMSDGGLKPKPTLVVGLDYVF